MKLLIGLGNPGELYTNNRHNVGFHFLNYFIHNIDRYCPNIIKKQNSFERSVKFRAKVCHIFDDKLIAKPQTYMNLSGIAVRKMHQFYKIETSDIFVAHDDLDIPLGQFKIQQTKGPKVHNGLASIEKELGTADFWRVRIGIENRSPENKISGHDYVLSNFTNEEKNMINTVSATILSQMKERNML
jgi:PTH1 family peptidyl-tRNA hydrolase